MTATDRGSATVLALALMSVVAVAVLVLWALADVVVARQRASVAADLAALAAVPHVGAGRTATCERAADLATRNGTRLVDCRIDGADVVVAVERDLTGAAARMAAWASAAPPSIVVRARAGPP